MKRYELMLAGILLSVSMVLKICSLVALCHDHIEIHELAHEEMPLSSKKHNANKPPRS